jgi:two-component system NarL family sensor kinase
LVLESTGYEHMAPEVEHELFRVAQEAISNAVQHAGAKSVRVAVRATLDGKTMLLIEDDGKGMSNGYGSSVDNRGIGMRSMRERAALLGARFQVDSAPGEGTRIVVEVPRTHT